MTEGQSKFHKIIEAGTNCGRNKSPEESGMVLEYESQYCDTSQEGEDPDTHHVPVKVDTDNCVNNVINNELNKHQDSNTNDTEDEWTGGETIETASDKEVVDDTVTLLSHSVKNSQQSLWVLSFIFAIFILQL